MAQNVGSCALERMAGAPRQFGMHIDQFNLVALEGIWRRGHREVTKADRQADWLRGTAMLRTRLRYRFGWNCLQVIETDAVSAPRTAREAGPNCLPFVGQLSSRSRGHR